MITALITGGIAGWLTGLIMKGEGYGILVNIVLGIIGGAIGNWLIHLVGFSKNGGFISDVLTAVIGAAALVTLIRALKR